MPQPRNVLFVCSGNQCRSPVAEVILRKRAAEAGLSVVVGSAGTLAGMTGFPAQEVTIEAAAELGFDLRGHVSRCITRAILQEAHLVLALARVHVRLLERAFPEEASRVRLFKPYCLGREAGGSSADDVPDPVGLPLEVHRACVREISGCLDQMVARWQREADVPDAPFS